MSRGRRWMVLASVLAVVLGAALASGEGRAVAGCCWGVFAEGHGIEGRVTFNGEQGTSLLGQMRPGPRVPPAGQEASLDLGQENAALEGRARVLILGFFTATPVCKGSDFELTARCANRLAWFYPADPTNGVPEAVFVENGVRSPASSLALSVLTEVGVPTSVVAPAPVSSGVEAPSTSGVEASAPVVTSEVRGASGATGEVMVAGTAGLGLVVGLGGLLVARRRRGSARAVGLGVAAGAMVLGGAAGLLDGGGRASAGGPPAVYAQGHGFEAITQLDTTKASSFLSSIVWPRMGEASDRAAPVEPAGRPQVELLMFHPHALLCGDAFRIAPECANEVMTFYPATEAFEAALVVRGQPHLVSPSMLYWLGRLGVPTQVASASAAASMPGASAEVVRSLRESRMSSEAQSASVAAALGLGVAMALGVLAVARRRGASMAGVASR